jgi:hypothetical protein
VPDRDILPMLPDGTLMIGGHDHLTLVRGRRDALCPYRLVGLAADRRLCRGATAKRRRSSRLPSTATALLPRI